VLVDDDRAEDDGDDRQEVGRGGRRGGPDVADEPAVQDVAKAGAEDTKDEQAHHGVGVSGRRPRRSSGRVKTQFAKQGRGENGPQEIPWGPFHL
jgi:hypothetical protein